MNLHSIESGEHPYISFCRERWATLTWRSHPTDPDLVQYKDMDPDLQDEEWSSYSTDNIRFSSGFEEWQQERNGA